MFGSLGLESIGQSEVAIQGPHRGERCHLMHDRFRMGGDHRSQDGILIESIQDHWFRAPGTQLFGAARSSRGRHNLMVSFLVIRNSRRTLRE
jgi:hypothetical protein